MGVVLDMQSLVVNLNSFLGWSNTSPESSRQKVVQLKTSERGEICETKQKMIDSFINLFLQVAYIPNIHNLYMLPYRVKSGQPPDDVVENIIVVFSAQNFLSLYKSLKLM